MGNTFKTAFLLTALTLLLMAIGRAFGGQNGMFIALAFAVVMNFVSYFYSDKIALSMYRAQPAQTGSDSRPRNVINRMYSDSRIVSPSSSATQYPSSACCASSQSRVRAKADSIRSWG